MDRIRRDMETEFALIDVAAAKEKAKADMIFVRRTLKTLFNDVNMCSVNTPSGALLTSHASIRKKLESVVCAMVLALVYASN